MKLGEFRSDLADTSARESTLICTPMIMLSKSNEICSGYFNHTYIIVQKIMMIMMMTMITAIIVMRINLQGELTDISA